MYEKLVDVLKSLVRMKYLILTRKWYKLLKKTFSSMWCWVIVTLYIYLSNNIYFVLLFKRKILTFWLTAWFRAVPPSLETSYDRRAVQKKTFITVESVDYSSIFRIISLHWAILQYVVNWYTACKDFICTKKFSVLASMSFPCYWDQVKSDGKVLWRMRNKI